MVKSIVCPCEDVTLHDLEDAAARGMTEIETIKRYTGLGTGPCQGRQCLVPASEFIAALPGRPARALQPFTPRPPHFPIALSQLAGMELPPLTPHDEAESVVVHRLAPTEPLPERAEVVIIGGGIMGLALAYQLGRRGVRDVLVLEKGYLLEGASGRNGGGVRAQWSTPINIELARESLALCEHFAQEMGINVWFRRGGYLFLARSKPSMERLEAAARLHRMHGLRTRLVTAAEAQNLVPDLDVSEVLGATFNPDDGVVFPWPFVWGYADGARSLGARIEPYTRVTGFDLAHGSIDAVHTDRGRVRTKQVVVAAGAWSPRVAALAGVALPSRPFRHEICTSEPLKPFVDPLVADLDSGLYFSQSLRGELVGGMGDPQEPPGLNQRSSLRFLGRYSKALLSLMPRLGGVRVVRQWAGCYDVTPDYAPILGETPGVKGMLQMSGFVGHGFMMAPAVARRMADWMGGAQDELFTRFTLSRFAEGRSETESMIIG